MRPTLRSVAIAFLTFFSFTTCAPGTTPQAAVMQPALDRLLAQTRLRYLDGSTEKVEQVIGDWDKQTNQPTFNQTIARYDVAGTDLGNSFEHNGRTYFLFGDTIGAHGGDGGDIVGVSDSSDPEQPLALDFLTGFHGRFLKIEPDGVPMYGFEVPVAGISLNGQMYVAVKTNYSRNPPAYTVLLTRYDEWQRNFDTVREMWRFPATRFVTFTMRLAPDGLEGLPTAGPYVLFFGSGDYRRSHAYLAATPVAGFESGEGTRYFAGVSGEGTPRWSEVESDAAPIIDHPTIGDISVTYVQELGLWLCLYDGRQPRSVVLSYAPQPWGPWSAPEILWDGARDAGYGHYIHTPFRARDDGLTGPVNTIGQDPFRVAGGIYAPYLLERFTRVQDDKLTLHYIMSTWNPYVIVRLKSTLTIEPGRGAGPPPAVRGEKHGNTANE